MNTWNASTVSLGGSPKTPAIQPKNLHVQKGGWCRTCNSITTLPLDHLHERLSICPTVSLLRKRSTSWENSQSCDREKRRACPRFRGSSEQAVSDVSDNLTTCTLINNLFCPPQGLLRFCEPESHIKYDDRLGCGCSSWTNCKPASSLEDLEQRGSLSVPNLRSHCEKEPRLSDWITLSEEASCMLRYVNMHGPNDGSPADSIQIALIGTAKMEGWVLSSIDPTFS